MLQNLSYTECGSLGNAIQTAQLADGRTVLLGNRGKGITGFNLMNRGAGLGLLGSNLLLLEVLALLFLGNCHLLLLCLAGSQCGIAIHQDTASVRTVNIIISLNILHLEVEQSLGVNELAQETGFKVKMGTGRTSSISTQTNGLAGSYRLIFLNQLFAHVAIQGFQTIGVADD